MPVQVVRATEWRFQQWCDDGSFEVGGAIAWAGDRLKISVMLAATCPVLSTWPEMQTGPAALQAFTQLRVEHITSGEYEQQVIGWELNFERCFCVELITEGRCHWLKG